MTRTFEPGETVALRYITRDGRPGMSWPYRVIEDREDLVVLFIPKGAIHKRWGQRDGVRGLVDQPWRRDTLRLMFPGAFHSVWLHWDVTGGAEDGRRFEGYYINMEEPFRRSAIGFDTNDHMLDVVVRPDLSWEWKDEDVMAERVSQGVYPADFAAIVRAEGEAAIAKLEARLAPFTGEWPEWRPDPAWPIPHLPEGWDTHPAELWDMREWAYTRTT